MHAGEPLDVLPGVRQRVAGSREGDRRCEHKQRDRVIGDAVEMVDECVGSRLVALLTPGRDGLDVAAVFVAAVCQRFPRTGEMAGDSVGAAGPVGPFGGDHRQRDVRACMVWIFGDRGGKGGRGAVLHREQPTHPFGI